MKTMTADRVPYDADHVHIVDLGNGRVIALWISDPAEAEHPRQVAETVYERYDAEVIATAQRFYKRDGADFSGWIVATPSDLYSHSDPIPTKREAMQSLRNAIADYFNR
ncbi:hypothetical protein ACIBHX_01760 [Nonomuraea sp. NPDC050536]|uniref:hypothetical protein n=1 Tax=Nonomuraea sp. NPDC050536 TaxID=3364366 RepID=UPI0037C8AF60